MEVAFGVEDVRVAGQLMDGTCIRQSFVAAAPFLRFVSVFLEVRDNPEQSSVTLDILAAMPRVGICSVTVDANTPKEFGGWCEFLVNRELVVGRRYEAMLWTLNCRAGMSPLVYCGKGGADGYMFMGARLMRGSELRCKFVYGDAV